MKKFVPEICPLCGEGQWVPFCDDKYEFRHGRKNHVVEGINYAQCSCCKVRGFLPGQRDANFALIKAYQGKLPGFISRSDLLALREQYGLTQQDANLIFGGGTQGYSKWERGLNVPAGPTARLIKMALKFPEVLKTLAAEVGIDVVVPHGADERSQSRVVTVYVTSQEAFDAVDAAFGSFNSTCDTEFEIDPVAIETWKNPTRRDSKRLN